MANCSIRVVEDNRIIHADAQKENLDAFDQLNQYTIIGVRHQFTVLQAVEVMASFKPFDGCVNGVAFDVYNEYQYATYGVPEVLRKIRKGLKESLT